MLIENFTEYNRLGLHPLHLSVFSTTVQDLLTFRVSIKKSGVNQAVVVHSFNLSTPEEEIVGSLCVRG